MRSQGVGARLPLLPRARPAAARGVATSGSTRCGARCPSCPTRAARASSREYGLPDVRRRGADRAQGRRRLLRGRGARPRQPKAVSNWVMGDVLRIVRERKLDDALVIRDWPVPPEHLGGAGRADRRRRDQRQDRQDGLRGDGRRAARRRRAIVAEQGLTPGLRRGRHRRRHRRRCWPPTPTRSPSTAAARTSCSASSSAR